MSFIETTVMIPGPCGHLEALVTNSETQELPTQIAIICHPHSLYGGSMNNKVVTTLARTFKELKCAVIRFNFRGVGKSTGTYADGKGEADDLNAVIAWAYKTWGHQTLWLAGFSFGSYVTAKVAKKHKIKELILVAPPVKNFEFTNLTSFSAPCLVLQGNLDEIVSAQAVADWVKTVKSPIKLINFPTATHFFHGHLSELRQRLFDQLASNTAF